MVNKVHHLVTVVPADKAEIDAKAQAHKATADAAKAAKKPAKATAAAK
jgi:hypothetical protein